MLLPLLPHQSKFLDIVFESLKDNRAILITGNSGCGKSYSFRWAKKNIADYGFYDTIILSGSYLEIDRDYAPFISTLSAPHKHLVNDAQQVVVEGAKDIPFVGNITSYIISTIMDSNFNRKVNSFNEEEQMIINQLKKLTKNKAICIICDNIHWWDKRSLKLLINILSLREIFPARYFGKLKFVLSITNNQESPFENFSKNDWVEMAFDVDARVDFPKFEYTEFKTCLYDETSHSLSKMQTELLFNLVNGHLKVFFEVVNEINRNSFDFNTTYDNNKLYLSEILNKRLTECGATGIQIAEVLEYASVIGMKFSDFELHKLTDYSKANIQKIIANATDMKLTEHMKQSNYYHFAHDIIREIFKDRVDENHMDYYHAMALCLRAIKPSQYLRRARYMLLSSNDKEAAILFCLEYISQLRNYGDATIATLAETASVISEIQNEYLEYMKNAYILYHQKKYKEALSNLKLILDCYPNELLAERDILKLRCYSKQLATQEITTDIHKLDGKRNTHEFKDEKEITERYTHALVTAYAHLGDIKSARELEEVTLQSLSERIDFDENCQLRLNIIKRNANAIHGIDTAPVYMKQAAKYFSQCDKSGEYTNVRQLYTALTNYSAILIKKGEFLEAHEQAIQGIRIEKENSDIIFQRTQIIRSNCILAGVLDNKITPEEAISLYTNLLGSLQGEMAEKLFYTSNLSIMYALNNQPDIALKVIQQESLNHDVDGEKEGIYQYRIKTNCAIYHYLLGENAKAIAILESQSESLKQLINGSYFTKKNEILLRIMLTRKEYTGESWLTAVHSECKEFQGPPWRYFGLGFAFAALCDWGV